MQGSRRTLVLRSAAIVSGALLALPAQALAGLTPDSPVSPNAEDTMTAYVVMGILGTLIALGVIAALLAAIRGGGDTDELPERRTRGTGAIQTGVGAILGVLALIVFTFGVLVTESTRQVQASTAEGLDPSAASDAPSDTRLELPEGGSPPLVIDVTAQQWLWRYEYPGGVFTYHELVVPADTAVILDLNSTDLVHRWWVPALGGAFDAVPGADNQTWFRADEVGTYEGRSTAFSGPGFNSMRAKVSVLEPTEFEAWLEQQKADIKAAQNSVQEAVDAGTAPGVSVGSESEDPLPPEGGEE